MANKDTRKEKQTRRLGTRNPRCQSCNETNPLALTGTFPSLICYECRSKQQGRTPIEQHHPAGKNNDEFTVPIPANDHRILSDLQIDWPVNTLRNPNGSPALAAAATVRAWSDILTELVQRILAWIPEFLEALDEFLRETLGDRWWEQMPKGGSK